MLHLILGVAGGIVLAVYAIAIVERWRQARLYKRGMEMLYPRLEPDQSSVSAHQREWEEYAARH